MTTGTNHPAVELESVVKRYGRGPKIISGLNLQIQPGEFVAIVGPSGCGKTTLLNLLGGLDRPDSGRVSVGGADLGLLRDRELSRFRNTTVGFIFQTYHLHPRLSALENVMLPALLGSMPTRQARQIAEEKLEAMGLSEFVDKMPATLSGGQMQRVAIARALAMEPSILLADEPTGNLDEATGKEILDRISLLNRERKMTVALVTHEAKIRAFAGRTLTMSQGALAPLSE